MRAILMKFLERPICRFCGGTGKDQYSAEYGLQPRTCDECYGDGRKLNLLAILTALSLLVVGTVAPIMLVRWLW